MNICDRSVYYYRLYALHMRTWAIYDLKAACAHACYVRLLGAFIALQFHNEINL